MKRLLTLLRVSALVVCLIAGICLGTNQLKPPKVTNLPDEVFKPLSEAESGMDFQLMLSDLKIMSSQVHSVDTPGLRITQGHIMSRAKELGYEAVSETHALSMDKIFSLLKNWTDYRNRPFDFTEEFVREYSGIGDKPNMVLNNISVLLDAPDTEETILFMAHTDSVIMGPGTFDDTVSCAALLEGMRLLKDQPLKRDLLFLFTDGEEQGLLGALKYVEDHPEMKEKVRLVINTEARGNRGSLIMFETSNNNLNIVRAYQKAVPFPVSFSIATAVYRSMENDTDLTAFLMEGYPGMNSACIEGFEVYHTENDNYETFSRDSAAHYMTSLVGLTHYFATTENLELEADQDAVFFPFLPGNLVVMPESTASLISYIIGILGLILILSLIVQKKARPMRVLTGFIVQLLLIAVVFFLTKGMVELLSQALNLKDYRTFLKFGSGEPVFIGLLLLISLGVFFIIDRFRPLGTSSLEKAAGIMLLPTALSLALPSLFPSASYLFSALALMMGLVILFHQVWPQSTDVLTPLAVIPVCLLFVPIIYLEFVALSLLSAHLPIALAVIPLSAVFSLALLNKNHP